MSEKNRLLELERIFQDELDDSNIKLSYESTTDDINEWDSLTHIMLVFAIEKYYEIKFNSNEIKNWVNIGEMIDSIEAKLRS